MVEKSNHREFSAARCILVSQALPAPALSFPPSGHQKLVSRCHHRLVLYMPTLFMSRHFREGDVAGGGDDCAMAVVVMVLK